MKFFSFLLSIICIPHLIAEKPILNTTLKNGTSVEIALLEASDQASLDEAKSLLITSFQDAYKNFTAAQLDLEDKPNFLAASFEDEKLEINPDIYFVVARDTACNYLIGFIQYNQDTTSKNQFYIRRLAVDPAYKRQGLGKILVLETIKQLTEQKDIRLTVVTRKINTPAVNFYHRLGFSDKSINDIHPGLSESFQGFELIVT